MPTEHVIPLLDLDSIPAEELSTTLAEAVKQTGFLHIKVEGLGIKREEVREIFRIVRSVSSRGKEDERLMKREWCSIKHFMILRKRRGKHVLMISNPATGTNLSAMTFVPPHPSTLIHTHSVTSPRQRLSEGKGGFDQKESFVFGHYLPPSTTSTQPLPPSIANKRKTLEEFHSKCHEAVCRIMDAFSEAMNLEKSYFRNAHTAGTNRFAVLFSFCRCGIGELKEGRQYIDDQLPSATRRYRCYRSSCWCSQRLFVSSLPFYSFLN
jgi:isopenicillin N synthase-like dioxygenase